MDDRTRDAIERIRLSTELDALDATFARDVRSHGFPNYAAGVLSARDSRRQFLLLRWPRSWLELYAAEGFAQEDFTLEIAQCQPQPFTWLEAAADRPGASARIFEAAAVFGWLDGLVVPVHGPGSTRGIVNLASPTRVELGPEDREAVELIALAAYLRARELVDAPQRHGALSEREREVLGCVANGKNDTEIAALLGISRTTAHTHIERAREKLGAATRAHAVALAMMRGEI